MNKIRQAEISNRNSAQGYRTELSHNERIPLTPRCSRTHITINMRLLNLIVVWLRIQGRAEVHKSSCPGLRSHAAHSQRADRQWAQHADVDPAGSSVPAAHRPEAARLDNSVLGLACDRPCCQG